MKLSLLVQFMAYLSAKELRGQMNMNSIKLPCEVNSGHSFYIPFWRSHSSTYGDNPKETNGLVSNKKGDQGALFQIKSWLQFGHAAQPASFFEWVQKWSSFPRKNTMQQSSNTLHMFFLTHSKAFSPSLYTNPGVFDRLISPRKILSEIIKHRHINSTTIRCFWGNCAATCLLIWQVVCNNHILAFWHPIFKQWYLLNPLKSNCKT